MGWDLFAEYGFFSCHPPNSKLINVNPVHRLKITGNTLQPYEITGFSLKFRRIGTILPTIIIKLVLHLCAVGNHFRIQSRARGHRFGYLSEKWNKIAAEKTQQTEKLEDRRVFQPQQHLQGDNVWPLIQNY